VRRADRLSVLLACVCAGLAVVIGLRTDPHLQDVDEAVYSQTVVAMQHGDGYYPAMRAALVTKEGVPPSEIRAVRPPTVYLALAQLPQPAWRWAVGAVYLAILLLAWRLGRGAGTLGGPLAVALTGLWVICAASFLYLHAELWGVPFLLAGVLALRNKKWAAAAALLAGAALIRELYAVAFVVGFVCAQERKWWWRIGTVSAALGALHVSLASSILASAGTQTPFGTDHLTWQYVLNALSPTDHPIGWFVGLVGGGLGMCGLMALRREDRGARTLLVSTLVMVPLAVFVGRNYWALTFGPALACFAVDGVAALARRSPRNALPVGAQIDVGVEARQLPHVDAVVGGKPREVGTRERHAAGNRTPV
jgi:hypothetical protein